MSATSRMAPVWSPDSREIRTSGYSAAGGADRRAAQQRQGAAKGDHVAEMVPDPVFTVNRNRPSWMISTQHGAVCWSANGEIPIGDNMPAAESWNAETCRCRRRRCARWTNSYPGSWAELAAERAQALGGGLGAQRCRLCMLERQELPGRASLASSAPVAGRGSLVAEAVAADLS